MTILRQSKLTFAGLAVLLRGTAAFAPPRPTGQGLSPAGCITTTFSTTQSSESPTKLVASDELLDLINKQVTNELSASQLYLSASLWCETHDLCGMAAYMRAESKEERDHAMGVIDYAQKRDFTIDLEELEVPDSGWSNVQELWETLLQAEEQNTQNILKLADAASACGDHATTAFLMPYHTVRLYYTYFECTLVLGITIYSLSHWTFLLFYILCFDAIRNKLIAKTI